MSKAFCRIVKQEGSIVHIGRYLDGKHDVTVELNLDHVADSKEFATLVEDIRVNGLKDSA